MLFQLIKRQKTLFKNRWELSHVCLKKTRALPCMMVGEVCLPQPNTIHMTTASFCFFLLKKKKMDFISLDTIFSIWFYLRQMCMLLA